MMVHLIAPDELDPDDALESRWLRDHDGAPALDRPHDEEIVRDGILDDGASIPVRAASRVFTARLALLKQREVIYDDVPY